MEYFAEGSPDRVIDPRRAAELIDGMLAALGKLRRVLLVPPDYTRRHSGAGALTALLYERLRAGAEVVILPALGTHEAMTAAERADMFPGIPADAFRVHDWRGDLHSLSEVPAAVIREITAGRLDDPVPCAVNRLLVEGPWDRIISIGQLVPHEVAGIANHAKNIFVGVGGADVINRTHFIGAVCGMEQAMGRADTPVRRVLAWMSAHCASDLPLSYLLTVRGRDSAGRIVTRGLFAGDDDACFVRGAALCTRVNITLLDEPVGKAVVHLDPREFKSTWLGNKAIYRTRMALADGGKLIVLAPGVKAFGEDGEVDRLIRKYGYRGTPHTLRMVRENADLAANLSAAAHLIHGSSEARFGITYAAGGLSRDEIADVGFEPGDLAALAAQYDPRKLRDGWNDVGGDRVFFVSNPGLGLWSLRDRFDASCAE